MSPTLARILIADDDPDIRESLRDWLERAGYLVEAVADGREAQARLEAARFDVVVTDLRMPGLDGLALLAEIERLAAPPKVIFLSGQATTTEAIAALRGGRSFDFFEKPLREMGMLSRSIAQALAVETAPRASEPVWPEPGAIAPPAQAALAVVRERFAEPLALTDVAGAVGYNAAYLSDLITRETGRPFSYWLNAARLAHSRSLLADTELPISQVAIASGFADPGYFARLFRQAHGRTPLAWRRDHRVVRPHPNG